MPYRRASTARKTAGHKDKDKSASTRLRSETPTLLESQSPGNGSQSDLTRRDFVYQASLRLDVDESESESDASNSGLEDQPLDVNDNVEQDTWINEGEEVIIEPSQPISTETSEPNYQPIPPPKPSQPSQPIPSKPSQPNPSTLPKPFNNAMPRDKREYSPDLGSSEVECFDPIDKSRAASANDNSCKRLKVSGRSGPGNGVNRTFRSNLDIVKKVRSGDDGLVIMQQDISSVRDIVSGLSLDIKKHLDDRLAQLQRSVMNDINEIRVLVHHGYGDRKRKKDTSRNEEADIPFFNIVFSDSIMQIVIEKCMIAHIISTMSEYTTVHPGGKKESGLQIARGAALAVRIMLFAVNLKKKEGRVMYKSELGKKFSEYREGIVLSALMAAKKNSFHIFRSPDDLVQGNEGDHGTGIDMNSKKPLLPAWLKGDFINSKHINDARLKTEETNGKNGEENHVLKFRNPSNTDEEVPIVAATLLYKKFIQKLNSARMCVKAGFFDEIGYLFVDWKQFGALADQSTMKLTWGRKKNFACKYDDFMAIPESVPCYSSGVGEEDEENQISSTNQKNRRLLCALMKDCPEMIVQVHHQVCIRKHAKKLDEKKRVTTKPDPYADDLTVPENSQTESQIYDSSESTDTQSESTKRTDSSQDDGDFEMKETLQRKINLIDISCRFLSCYGSQVLHRSPASFLCSSKDSLRSIYALAVLLKRLLSKAINALEVNEAGSGAILDNTHVNGINLRAFLPSPARQKSGVLTKSVHMFRTLFNSRCTQTVDLTSVDGQNDPGNSNDSTDVTFGRKTKVTAIA